MQIFRAGPGRGSWRENLVETREIVLAQPDIDRPDIFFQMTAVIIILGAELNRGLIELRKLSNGKSAANGNGPSALA